MLSKERQTADALVAAFNSWDIDTIIALRTPECKRVFLPSSLKYPAQDNEKFRAILLGWKSVLNPLEVTVTDVIEGTSIETGKKKIVLYIIARGDTPVGAYNDECVWKMGFDDSGGKISEWSEYIDVVSDHQYIDLPKLSTDNVPSLGHLPRHISTVED